MTRAFRYTLFLASVLAVSVSASSQTASDGTAANRSLNDTNAAVKRAYSDGRLDLGAPFDVEMKATVGRDGKLDPATISFPRSEGDAGMTALVKSYLTAIDQSGYTKYLGDIGATDITVRARQDSSVFNASLTTEMTNTLRAITIKSLFSILIDTARRDKVPLENPSEADRRDLTLLNGTTVNTSGRSVIVALELPKATFREMVEKELKK